MENLPPSQFQPLHVSLAHRLQSCSHKPSSSKSIRKTINDNPDFPDSPLVETIVDETSGIISKIVITCTCGQQLELSCDYTNPILESAAPSKQENTDQEVQGAEN